jgi:hypothetical protein
LPVSLEVLTGEPRSFGLDGVETDAEGGKRAVELGLRLKGRCHLGIDDLAEEELAFSARQN